MTEPSGNLEARVDALESRVDELTGQLRQTKQDALAARVLAGGADRDVGEIRSEIHARLDTTAAGLSHITELLNGLAAEREND